jgi:hypothetical protein
MVISITQYLGKHVRVGFHVGHPVHQILVEL